MQIKLVAMIKPPMAKRGALTKILINPFAKTCTWVTSFVSLVINDARSNLSILLKDKV